VHCTYDGRARKKFSEKHALCAAQHNGSRKIIQLLGSDRTRSAKDLSAACNLHHRKHLGRIDAAQYAVEMRLNRIIA